MRFMGIEPVVGLLRGSAGLMHVFGRRRGARFPGRKKGKAPGGISGEGLRM